MVEIDKKILLFIENHKVITIRQCKNMFYKGPNAHEYARKKLRSLELKGLLKSYVNTITREKMYYITQKISAHDNYVLDFYTELIQNECEILEFKKNLWIYNQQLRPDAYFKFKYSGYIYFVLLEVDLTHITNTSKFQKYEMFYKTGEMQKECMNVFPCIIVVGDTKIQYSSNNFDTEYINFKLDNFRKIVLATDTL